VKRLGLAALTPVRAVIAVQLAVIIVAGIATVLSLPKFTGDEIAHFSYLQSVAEEGQLPLLGPTLISPQAEAIYETKAPTRRPAGSIQLSAGSVAAATRPSSRRSTTCSGQRRSA